MPDRFKAATAVLTSCVLAVGMAATAEAAKTPKNAKLEIVGGLEFEAGHHVLDDQRFSKRVTAVRSGGRITLVNRAKTPDPHTLSLVKRSALPNSFECEACGPFFGAHEVNEETGEPGKPLVDVGATGFDQPGDSVVIGPRGRVTLDVTAAKGKRLHYLCAVHPWMQGSIAVR